ncbi:MAG: DUF4974 domain-containing protein [Bacteroidales bacterium]|nr:DUF4974 domain-containing protein [Bacteroidales bacterium]
MDENIIIRVIRGEATESENKAVLEWINQSDENLKLFSELKMMWAISSAPDEEASEKQLLEIKNTIRNRRWSNLNDRRFWFGFASAASVAVVILFAGIFTRDLGVDNSTKMLNSKSEEIVVVNQMYMYTYKGVKGKVVLPDGSTVWLNSDSKLAYPDNFIGDLREVEISGEAYFEVKKDSTKPMLVKTPKGFTIRVTGTAFSVKSYENDLVSKAILYNGSIELITNYGRDKEEVVLDLKPNDCATIAVDGTTKITQIEKTTDIAWLKGEIIFEDTPMNEVLKVIERWYGKKIEVKDSSFFNYKLNATFKSESLVQILDIINLCTSIKYRIVDDKVIFQ